MAKNDVTVKITQKQVAGSPGFGVPLIVQGMVAEDKPYALYHELGELSEVGFGPTSAVYKQCEKMFMQKERPEKVGVCAGKIKTSEILKALKDADYRQIIPVLGESDDTIQELSAYVETTEDKMLFVRVEDVSALGALGKLDRTMAIVYSGENIGVEGAVVGATAGRTVGSFTYKNIILEGIAEDALDDAQIELIHKAGGICIVRKAGDVVTSEGIVLSGEYTDIIDSKDYVIRAIAYGAQKLLNDSPKLFFNNAGISQLESVVTNVLKTAAAMGIVATDADGVPEYSTNFATRDETSKKDQAARTYKGGKFSFSLAGAIHYATIDGTIEA